MRSILIVIVMALTGFFLVRASKQFTETRYQLEKIHRLFDQDCMVLLDNKEKCDKAWEELTE